jgi:hypothetical protein
MAGSTGNLKQIAAELMSRREIAPHRQPDKEERGQGRLHEDHDLAGMILGSELTPP